MTTPQAPGAPEGGQTSGDQPAPGAQDPAPQQETAPKPQQNKPLGKPSPQAPGAPEAKPVTEAAGKDDPQDVSSLPEWAQKALKKARADAGNARTTAKQQAAEEAKTQLLADISKAIGLNPGAEPTVEDFKAQIGEKDSRIDELEAQVAEHSYEKAIRAAAKPLNADADALYDSGAFSKAVQKELAQLPGDEFDDDDLATAVAAVAKEFAKQPRFQKTAAPARSGGEITGGPPPPTKQRPKSLTEALGRAYGGG